MDALQQTDAESAAFYKAPRVSLADIEAAIASKFHMTGSEAAKIAGSEPHPLDVLTICIIVMRNGFTVLGKSAPASPANFDAEYGKKLAYEDAVRQLWPLMGFALKDRLAAPPAVTANI